MRKTKMNDKQMAKLFWTVKAALVVVLLYVAVKAVIGPFQLDTGLKPKAVAGDERPQNATATAPLPHKSTDYSAILDNDVFGGHSQTTGSKSASAATPTVPALPSAEKLGLKLRGIVAGSPVTSRAIIEDTTTKRTIPYKIGDRVGPATVESIEPEQVILLHDGRKAALQMHIGAAEPDGPPTQTLEAATRKPVAVNQQGPQPSVRLGYVEELFREATIKPHVKNGQTQGLQISDLKETPLTKLFGLRNGDIVQTVNGQDLISKQKAFQVLKKARTQPSINLQLLRDGKTKELSFDL